ncbi:unnamed protein product [Blepharisma stoltei]|uniref:START domain-containing protein n=1 Tax=Blepharisma stoltei TaxID=1481888 RepID=A0AAU9K1X7_9CILI|nr:unnamed protein product [Blepharisma stoltei]
MGHRKHRKTRSCAVVSEIFPRVVQPELNCYELDLQKICETLGKTDRRYLGTIIGGSILAVLGFVIFTGATVVGGIVGGVLGLGIGHALGRTWKRSKIPKNSLTKEKEYEFRLTCLMYYMKKLKKSKIPISDFAGILEHIINEYRPAFILQLHNPAIMKEVQNLKKFLSKNVPHAALINSVAELRYSVDFNVNTSITAARLKHVYIPIMQLLKETPDREDHELEAVRQIELLISRKKTKKILKNSQAHEEDLIEQVLPCSALHCSQASHNFPSCKAINDLDYFLKTKGECFKRKSWENKVISERLLFRRASIPGYTRSSPYHKLQFKDIERLAMISSISSSITTFTSPIFAKAEEEPAESVASDLESVANERDITIKIESPIRTYDKKFTSSIIPPKSPPPPFQGLVNDIDQSVSSEEAEEEKSPDQSRSMRESFEIQRASSIKKLQNSPEIDKQINTVKIDVSIHKFQSDFDLLLEIEKEVNSDKIWRHVVDKPGTQCYQKKVSDSPICMIKAFCEVDYPAETVYKAIWDTTVRTEWDKLFHEFKIIDKTADYEVLYYMIKTPMGITRRDWLQRRIELRNYPEPNTIMLHFISMEHPMMPPRKGVIRAETLISGYIIRPMTQRSCKVTIITQNDVKGLIPTYLVNKFAAKAPADWCTNMRRGCKLIAGY